MRQDEYDLAVKSRCEQCLVADPAILTDGPAARTTMQKYRLYQVDAFTTRRFTGNPAGVIPNADGLSDTEMQAIARELNNSETAFIFRPDARRS